ncbi:lysophospholipid acyltransferase family protein [Yoonia sp.]|uniref:lysophospholipid acyltransferase family protein n=1 Tax=Yoonia sp. TaxID=2212373 RepID=UPI0025F1B55A|nr:lysophospholipid acyltransferase family protein [Yoonia sp.]
MPETTHDRLATEYDAPVVYDRRALTYANTFDSARKRILIMAIEWVTAKISVIRMIRRFEKKGKFKGQAFWRGALDVMEIDLLTPQDQLAQIPMTGPVVLVANHPHGLVDGMILADLIGRVRTDYRILTRSILTGIDADATKFMIAVPFPHEPDAQKKMVDMRHAAMAHLRDGGLVALFPSGVVATSDTMFGPVIERDWNVFTAKMIRKSGAAVVPCFFPGSNSRLYQIANRVSATLRQGLLLHEIVRASGKPQKPVIGAALSHDDIKDKVSDQRGFMVWLRQLTLDLGAAR